jgi:hypothetical protein
LVSHTVLSGYCGVPGASHVHVYTVPAPTVAHYAARHHEDPDQVAQVEAWQVRGNALSLIFDPTGVGWADSLFRMRLELRRLICTRTSSLEIAFCFANSDSRYIH